MMSGEPPKPEEWVKSIFEITGKDFTSLSLRIFNYQYKYNELYRQFCDLLHIIPESVTDLTKIPFLPVSIFKTAEVKSGSFSPEVVFESSGTTTTKNSKHFVRDLSIYHKSNLSAFRMFYGDPKEYCILALLPSYLEREHSSLIYMVNGLMEYSGHALNGFYLDDHDRLAQTLSNLEKKGQKTLLIGVTYALVDFAANNHIPLKHTIILETGGMKGRKKEMLRTEVHQILKEAFDLPKIHSEYGMTELLSQAYSKGDGLFRCPPWMHICIREEDDPMSVHVNVNSITTGVVNVIDLANINSCSFIATDDLGKLYPDKGFEILGRVDNSDIRGCSLLTL